MKIAGIDYGSKLAGTTVAAAFNSQGCVVFFSSQPRKDADRFILDWVRENTPGKVFLDAPLSLPGVYRFPGLFDDYFYRKADRELRAMSPMFLGGLTARAVRLSSELAGKGVLVQEVYPAHLARLLALQEWEYKKKITVPEAFLNHLLPILPFPVVSPGRWSWHHVDALLAIYSGWRFEQGLHKSFGDPGEGLIIV